MSEEADAVTGVPISTGIHAVAAAVLASKQASSAELRLAGFVLRTDQKRGLPREIESIAESFNRLMDAAIESCNASSGEATRAARRSRLAKDLDRAGVLLVDRDYLAGLIAGQIERLLPVDDGEDFGAELVDDDEGFVGDPGRDPLEADWPAVND